MKKIIKGIVVSISGDKTAKVKSVRKVRHKKYLKICSITKNYLVHDESNSCKINDTVHIKECRPISKLKRFRVLSEAEINKIQEQNKK